MILFWLYYNTFWSDLFLEAKAEILKQNRWFLGDLKVLKRHFEIKWPLDIVVLRIALTPDGPFFLAPSLSFWSGDIYFWPFEVIEPNSFQISKNLIWTPP